MPDHSEQLEHLKAALADRYRIERALGRGGMATVYLAEDLKTRRKVAIKVLKPEIAAVVGPDRFLREIVITAKLDHPHILPLHDSGEADGFLYFVMPYVEGGTLRDRLKREKQLSIEDAIQTTREVADALDFAHRHNVIHRDIKPENILLAAGHARVADFGVARALSEAGGERLTESGVAVGTPEYMSPEQSAGGDDLDQRTDVYSLACVVYEMLAGEPPFTGPSAQAILAKHMQAAVPDLSVVRPTINPHTQQVMATALAKVCADRFATAGEFARALEESLPAVDRGKRRRRLVTAGVATVTVPAIAIAVSLWITDCGSPTDAEGPPSGEAAELPRVAVLYFEDLTPDASFGHIADGLTEELIYELSGVNTFRVISKGGVRPYRTREVPFDSVVAALGANTVIDGSIQPVGNRLRVMVQLIDASSSTVVDRVSVERPLAQFVTLEREVAQQVAVALRRRMGREVRLRGATMGTSSSRARELVLWAARAREDADTLAAHKHPEDVRAAVEALQRADSLLALAHAVDPRWIRPLIDRGWAARDRGRLLRAPARVPVFEEGMRYAEQALALEPGNAEALELRGTLQWQLVTELEDAPTDPERLAKAESDLRAALDRDSTLANAWATLAFLFVTKGSFAEARLAAERALQVDAYLEDGYNVYVELFFSSLMLSDFEQAALWAHRGRLSFPGHWRFVEFELTLMRHDLDATPDPDRAWELVAELEQLDPPDKAREAGRQYHTIYRRVVAATISALAGHSDIARAEIARAIDATEGDPTLRLDLAYDEAYLRLVLGERERAAELLRNLVEARPVLRSQLARDPLFRDLRLSL